MWETALGRESGRVGEWESGRRGRGLDSMWLNKDAYSRMGYDGAFPAMILKIKKIVPEINAFNTRSQIHLRTKETKED
jgi:hypothetical protein